MGFCLFNNVAAAAATALAHGLERVAVVDFDVHHGNGTQEAFWSDRRVLFVSSHQYPFYPGTGSLEEQGGGAGEGFTVNLPMPAGCGDGEYAAAYREIVAPILRAYDPQLVLVSAGFDAAAGDPLAGMRLSPEGFAAVVDVCVAASESSSARGRLVAVLEGGYATEALASGARVLVRQMTAGGEPSRGQPEAGADGPGRTLLDGLRRAHASHWPVLRSP
jgi:acetoin utilization deacetylase AcuC-like enzyme